MHNHVSKEDVPIAHLTLYHVLSVPSCSCIKFTNRRFMAGTSNLGAKDIHFIESSAWEINLLLFGATWNFQTDQMCRGKSKVHGAWSSHHEWVFSAPLWEWPFPFMAKTHRSMPWPLSCCQSQTLGGAVQSASPYVCVCIQSEYCTRIHCIRIWGARFQEGLYIFSYTKHIVR